MTCSCNSVSDEINIQSIQEDGVYARFISHPSNRAHPLVCIMPGSSPGFIPNRHLVGLARSGYDVLSLAYHGIGTLPKKLKEIPLEYFNTAVKMTQKLSSQRNRPIILLGISKGAEGALIYASQYDDIDGLILYTPGSWVLPNHVDHRKGIEFKSSWTFRGVPLDYLPLEPFVDPPGLVEYSYYFQKAIRDTIFSNPFLIAADQINCPLLMMSGSDDQVWPSAKMSKLIENRIIKNNAGFPIERLVFQNAGHQFFWFGDGHPSILSDYQSIRLTGIKKHRFAFGGTEEGNLMAMELSQDAVLSFLSRMAK